MSQITPERPDLFLTTRWTAVLQVGRSDPAQAHQALADLCQAYWYPLYAYARRQGHSRHDAEDLTQGFFAQLLRRNSIREVSPERGKFRAFLLAAMNNYLGTQQRRGSAQKRGAACTIALDAEAAELRYARGPAEQYSPTHFFDRQWALAILEAAVQRLRKEYEGSGRGSIFAELHFAISADQRATPYAEVAARLGRSEETARVAVHRLRRRYREVLREEIAQTVLDEAEIAGELRYLIEILSA